MTVHNHPFARCRLPLAILLLVVLTACHRDGSPDDAASTYSSMWSELYPATLQSETPADTLQGAFRFAAAARTPLEAQNRWSGFLAEWDPPNGAFEDAMHANLVAWARLELARAQALLNDPAEVDRINRELRALAAQME